MVATILKNQPIKYSACTLNNESKQRRRNKFKSGGMNNL